MISSGDKPGKGLTPVIAPFILLRILPLTLLTNSFLRLGKSSGLIPSLYVSLICSFQDFSTASIASLAITACFIITTEGCFNNPLIPPDKSKVEFVAALDLSLKDLRAVSTFSNPSTPLTYFSSFVIAAVISFERLLKRSIKVLIPMAPTPIAPPTTPPATCEPTFPVVCHALLTA